MCARSITQAHHWPRLNGVRKIKEESRIEKNWRVVMMVANTTAPYRLMVQLITSCTAAEMTLSAKIHQSASGFRSTNAHAGTNWWAASAPKSERRVEHAVVYSTCGTSMGSRSMHIW